MVFLLARRDDNQWYEIEYPPNSGGIGWISAEFVRPDRNTSVLPVGFTVPPPPPGALFGAVRTEGDPLRVRSGPGTDYDVLARLSNGTRVTLVARSPDGAWYQLLYPPDSQQRGWVSAEFVVVEGSSGDLQVALIPPTPTPGPTPLPTPTRAPQAPRGGTILATSNRGGTYDIFALSEDGQVVKQITRSGGAFGARFAPGGDRIVFYRTVQTAPFAVSHIFAASADGSNLVDLTAVSGGGGSASDTDPDWSPDGRQIVFVRTPRAGAPQLHVMNADGSGARRLLDLSAASGVAGDYSPAPRWSPDGGRIVFAAVPEAPLPGAPLFPSIFVVNRDGSELRQLTDNDMINANPVWSPDGKEIAWAAKDILSRGNWRVWIMNSAGGDQRLAFHPPGGDAQNGVQTASWRGNQLLLAGWTGSWNVYLGEMGGTLQPITTGFSDTIPTDWLP